MKILLINKFYWLSGGAERYLFEWEKMLRARGHEVVVFSMRHPENRPCAQEKYFAEEVRFRGALSAGQKLRAATHSVWSTEAGEKLRGLLREEGRPDLVHLHSFMYQLTPSILKPLAELNIPIVQTCHEYVHICAHQHLYNDRTGRTCEACLTHGRLSPLWTRCMKGSFAASAAGWLAGVAARRVGLTHKRIRRFVAVSEFMRGKLIAGGLQADRVVHLPNFIDPASVQPSADAGGYMLFLGRLVPQKGVATFLRAAEVAPDVPCKMAGDGPMETFARNFLRERKLRNVELLGKLDGDKLWQTVRAARAVVVPSEWHEPFGLVILEAMAAARPVIASRVAGPAEIVAHEKDGLLFSPFSAEELSSAMRALWADPQRAIAMGREGRSKVEIEYNAERHYERMMRLFEEAMR